MNVVHSVDAFILREVHRRCNYDPLALHFAHQALVEEQTLRNQGMSKQMPLDGVVQGTTLEYYLQQYARSGMPSAVILPEIFTGLETQYLSDRHLEQLVAITTRMKEHAKFEVVTIHDEFKCSPVNMNALRQHYIDIFAELAESEVLSDLLGQIHGKQGTWQKLSNNLGQLIRGSNYALS